MDIMDLIKSQLQNGGALEQLSNQIGGTPEQTKNGIESALPSLIGALSRKGQQGGQSASGILSLLDKDGDGDFMDDLPGFISQGNDSHGAADIVNNLFGNKRGKIEEAVSENSGLSKQASSNLFQQLGPLVMNVIGKQKNQGGMDISSIMSLLNNQSKKAEGSGNLGFLTNLLDKDGDGSIMDEATGLLGGLFGRKKR